MTAAAFALFQGLRWQLRDTRAARSTVGRTRDMLLEVAIRVVTSVRRVVLPHFGTFVRTMVRRIPDGAEGVFDRTGAMTRTRPAAGSAASPARQRASSATTGPRPTRT